LKVELSNSTNIFLVFLIIKSKETMQSCKNCGFKHNQRKCPVCDTKRTSSGGGILEGIFLLAAIIFAILVVAATGGIVAGLIYLFLYKKINEKYRLLLANTCLVLGIFIGAAIFKYTEKLPVEYDTYQYIGIGILLVIGYFSYKFMYKTALNNSKGLFDNVEYVFTTKSFIFRNLNKDIDNLKNSPEWKQNIRKINETRVEMEKYLDKNEARLAQYDEWEKHPEKYGLNAKDVKAMRDAAIAGWKYTNHALGNKDKK
jgi:rubrerythrin